MHLLVWMCHLSFGVGLLPSCKDTCMLNYQEQIAGAAPARHHSKVKSVFPHAFVLLNLATDMHKSCR